MSHMTRTDRLERLERMQQLFAEQLAEQNLRVRFLMEFFKVKGTSSVLAGPDGKPVIEELTLFEFYQRRGREEMMAALTAELKELEEHARVEREAETTDPAIDGQALGDATEEDRASTPLAFAARRDTH